MPSDIQMRVENLLMAANSGPVEISEELIEAFGEAAKRTVRKNLTEARSSEFTLRMSNIGRPACQLSHDKAKTLGEADPPNTKIKSIFGDVVEALMILLLRASGVEIQSEQEAVTTTIGGTTVNGTLDVVINGRVWDIKSASEFAFRHKFGPGCSYESLLNKDDFGYGAQGFGYAKAKGLPFGGWIAMNKSSGQINVIELPDNQERQADAILDKATATIAAVTEGKAELIAPVPEFFKGKPTGNMVLTKQCEFCKYKFTCYPRVVERYSLPSSAIAKKVVFYTHIADKWKTNQDV